MEDKENDDYGLRFCLDVLRSASGRALDLQIQSMDDPRLTAARRLINAKDVLNLWLRTETLHHQRLRLQEPVKTLQKPSEQAAAPVVFQLHQHQEK